METLRKTGIIIVTIVLIIAIWIFNGINFFGVSLWDWLELLVVPVSIAGELAVRSKFPADVLENAGSALMLAFEPAGGTINA